jgi:hypothetical protein
MNSTILKMVAYCMIGVACAVILSAWGYFAFHGKTDVAPFIAQLGGMITILVAVGGTIGGFHAAVAAAAPTVVTASDPDASDPSVIALPTSINK